MDRIQDIIGQMRKRLKGEIKELQYESLEDLLDFSNFDWHLWLRDEREVLQPQLEAMGYTNVFWSMGDHDFFGPLTRVCRAIDTNGEMRWFIYG